MFVFGVGLGEIVDALLAARPDVGVVAWDRDPWLLRLALGQNDWSAALASGRLRLLLGTDLVEHAAAMRARGAAVLTAFHPFLGTLYRHERAWLEPAALDRPLVAAVRGRALRRRSRGRARARRLRALHHRHPPPGARGAGSHDEPAAPAADRRDQLHRGPGRVRGGAPLPADLLADRSHDQRTAALAGAGHAASGAFLFTYRRAEVAELRAGGFTHVEYLPLAADLERRAPVPLTAGERARYGTPVSFVGSSMQPQAAGFRQSFVAALAGTRPGATDAADAAVVLEEMLAEQRSDFTRFVVPDALARRVPELGARVPTWWRSSARWAGEIAAAEKRLAYVGRLGRFGVCVWGDEGWRAAQSAGLACHYRGPAGHGLELTKIYCASLINIDIGRVYQDDIVTMRVFDVLACGGFVLAERSPALAELFEIGAEVECYGRPTSSRPRSRITWPTPRPRGRSRCADARRCVRATASTRGWRTCWLVAGLRPQPIDAR